ncbi:hypothetical protein [Legionella nagasakiensis]|uniref:hypothetical protein n=1 Tax=Legionella nagasakiensis TaxID=535290 RepID=UPI0010561610|nr:hypothetical protein [Legionella nagasakiensis]
MDIKQYCSYLMLMLCGSAWGITTATSNFARVITITGGVAVSQPGETQTLYPTNVINIPIIGLSNGVPAVVGSTSVTNTVANTYNAKKHWQAIGTGEVFLGLQWLINPLIINQLGVAFGGAGEANLQGTITINSVPSGSQYKYQTNHGKVVARDKLLFCLPNYSIQPFITGSFGASFNTAHGYYTYPMINSSVSAPWFEDKTQSFSYTYSLGLGIQKNINRNWNVALGYEFADWGRSGLGSGTFGVQDDIQILGTSFTVSEPATYNGPKLSHIYTHNVLLSVSYLY